MAPKCPLCNRVYINPNCAIKLYQSENECTICLTKGKKMLALPCGHQFCEEDIKKIGFGTPNIDRQINQPTTSTYRTPFVVNRQIVPTTIRGFQIAPQANPFLAQRNARRVLNARRALFRRNRNRRKRCGWCGHIGHELRKCKIHERQCGCRTGCRTNRHTSILNKKKKCNLCNKKGHRAGTCSKIYTF